MSSPLKAIQVEVTNRCNFKCVYCIRNFWKIKEGEMDFTLYKKLSDSFPGLEKVVLYGLGEPLMHNRFLDMVHLTRAKLGDSGQIIFSTNGSLLTEKVAHKLIVEEGVNKISFSLDTPDHTSLEKLRVGSQEAEIIRNLKNVSNLKQKARLPFSLSLEVVLMKDNYKDLVSLVEFASENQVDEILVTNVVSYSEDLMDRQLFMTYSKQSYELVGNIIDQGWKIIYDSVISVYSKSHTGRYDGRNLRAFERIQAKARKKGYWLNLPLILDSQDRISEIEKVNDVFEIVSKMARRDDIKLELPKLLGDKKTRSCPYIENQMTVVRADGKVTPCLEFMYPHREFVNSHIKEVDEVIFGDINVDSIFNIWSDGEYVKFRDLRQFKDDTIPWCGDCPYSTLNCFYVRSNKVDCLSNTNSCSECLYSMGIAKCAI